jgi:RimJ/RimL family protein N-acetyltransferase
MAPRIDTARLRLEPLAARHFEPLYRIYQEPDVGRFLITRARDRSEFSSLFEHALSFGASHGMWAIYTRSPRAFAGRVGFFAFASQRRPELAFLLGARFWGRGLATEAARSALAHGFAAHQWHECIALVRPDNLGALRVCAKLAMEYETSIDLSGSAAHVYQVTREAFEAGRAAGR